MNTTFTPGPWLINTAGSAKRGEPFKITEVYVYAPETQDDTAICADVIDPVTQEPSEANARLIAAAPDLYEALKTIKDRLTRCALAGASAEDACDSFYQDVIDAAIAKAEGKS